MTVWALVDGGGSKTRVRLIDAAHGDILGEATAGPGNLTRGADQVWSSIHDALGSLDQTPEALYCGLAGVESALHRDRFLATSRYPLTLISDRDSGLLGAHQGKPGACLTVGTGVALAWMGLDGSIAKRAGLGFVLGDEGGGAWLGRRAFQRIARQLDGLEDSGVDTAVLARFGVGATLAEVVAFGQQATPDVFAKYAPLVFELEQEGLHLGRTVVTEALSELMTLLAEVPTELPLALVGGLAPLYRERFQALGVSTVQAKGDALDGLWLDAQSPVQTIERWCSVN